MASDWILGQFGQRRRHAQETYRKFVEEGIIQRPSPWTNLSGQIYLGSEVFRRRMQRMVRAKDDPEIPKEHSRPARPSAERLLGRVTAAYGVKREELMRSTRRPSEARQVAIYLLRHEAGLTLREIARRFGVGYSPVGHRISAVKARLRANRQLRVQLEKCKDKT